MIDRRYLKSGLETALSFANGPAPLKGKTISIPHFSFGMEPQDVAAGSSVLWKEWRGWLSKFNRGKVQPGPALEQLRNWCVENARGHVGFFDNEILPAFSFDDQGAPQAHLFPKSLQGLLAVVGAELIAPAPPFTVTKCARKECENWIVKVLVRHRSDGRPTEYCALPNGASHALTNAERGRRARKIDPLKRAVRVAQLGFLTAEKRRRWLNKLHPDRLGREQTVTERNAYTLFSKTSPKK